MSEHMSSYGNNFKVTLGGTSHGPAIWVNIDGVPAGTVIDFAVLDKFMSRRAASSYELATERREPDNVIFDSGVVNFGGAYGIVTGSSIQAHVENTDVKSEDYEAYRFTPRPGHADFTSVMKDGERAEIAGGGRFSGRLTAGLCIAGGIAKQILESRGISVFADILSIGGDKSPLDFEDIIEAAKLRGDSVGGVIECSVDGLEAGSCGDNLWDGLESRIAQAMYGIPAVKGVEFGSGFKGSDMLGSENNDAFYCDDDGKVRTATNNHGGILGGIATGMPVVFRCAVKPTPSIAKEQDTVDIRIGKSVKISVKGRHDPCIVPRAVPCVEAAAAIAVLDALLEEEKKDSGLDSQSAAGSENEKKLAEARKAIDIQNGIIVEALKKRFDVAKSIATVKQAVGMPVKDEAREKEILGNIEIKAANEAAEYKDEIMEIFRRIIAETRKFEEKEMK